MKRIFIVLLTFMLLTGCKSKKEEVIVVEQDFKNIQLTLYSGELTVEIGEELSLAHQNGSLVDYKIENDTLIIEKTSRGDLTLTLPQYYIYDTIDIHSYGGDLSFKPMPECQNLNLDIDRGNIVLSKANTINTNILLNSGYIFISGKLGEKVNINCHDGYMKLKPSCYKVDYNYNLNLQQTGYLNLGGYKYDNLQVKEQVFNRKQQQMNIDVQNGNVIIKFKG